MSDETRALKSLVVSWEKKLKQAEKMLTHLRAALAIEEPEASAAPRKRLKEGQPPFGTKYEKSAREYLHDVLSRAMTLREIQDALAKMGKSYADQAVVFALERMAKRGEVEPRRPAPPGSASKYIYGPVKAHQQEEAVLHRRVG
jgi:hypothetical protein